MLIRNFILWLSRKKRVTDVIARRGMRSGFARRFIAGETLEEALVASVELCRAGRRITLNRLGENVGSRPEAEAARDTYLRMVRELAAAKLDGILSVKLTQVGLDLDRQLCQELTLQIAAGAQAAGQIIELDMEGTPYTDVTLEIYEATQQRFAGAGLAIQAYLHRSEKDIERLLPLRPRIRLVKGAYREPPALAIQKKRDVDANFCRLMDLLLDHAAAGRCFLAIGTHDPAMHEHAKKGIAERKLAAGRYEFQMLYGIRRDLQQQLRDAGHPLRVYIPFGTEWCPYFMRRLAERPANIWFILRNLFAESSPEAA
jgi:proline dehydrogenase